MFEAPNDGRVVNCNPPFEWDMCLGKGSEDFRYWGRGSVGIAIRRFRSDFSNKMSDPIRINTKFC